MSHFFADDGAKIDLSISDDGSPLSMLHGWTSADGVPKLTAFGLNERAREKYLAGASASGW